MRLTRPLRPTKPNQCLPSRLFRRQPIANTRLGIQRNMALKFSGEIRVAVAGTKQSQKTLDQCTQLAHMSSLSLFSRFKKSC